MVEKYTDVEFEELEDNVYYTAVQVGEILGETDSTIRSWCKDSALGEVLNIKKINGRNKFTKGDIEKLRFVKELRDKNYSISQTREYISKQGFKYGEYDGGLVDPKDPLGFEALSIRLAQKQNEELQQFKKDILTEMSKFMYIMMDEQKNYLQGVTDELAISLESKIEKMNNIGEVILDNTKNKLDEFTQNIDNNFKNQEKAISDIYNENSKEISSQIEEVRTSFEKVNDKVKETLDSVGDEFKKELDIAVSDIKKTLDIKYVPRDEFDKNKKESWLSKIFK